MTGVTIPNRFDKFYWENRPPHFDFGFWILNCPPE
jgi:hypothetical protein